MFVPLRLRGKVPSFGSLPVSLRDDGGRLARALNILEGAELVRVTLCSDRQSFRGTVSGRNDEFSIVRWNVGFKSPSSTTIQPKPSYSACVAISPSLSDDCITQLLLECWPCTTGHLSLPF